MKFIFQYGLLTFCLVIWADVLFAQLSPGELSSAHEHLEGLKNCTKCHILREKETTSKCLACHKEIQQLIDQKRGYHSSAEVTGKECADCHGEHFGRSFDIVRFDANSFNHDLTGYVLEGKHIQQNCTDCHKTELIQNNISQKKENTYLGLGTECLSCHDDYHQGKQSSNCTTCHTQDAFLPTLGFDHAQTRFALVGKHQTMECEDCHRIEKEGRDFNQFGQVELVQCYGCHDDVHNNQYGRNCKECHNESSFAPIEKVAAVPTQVQQQEQLPENTFNHNESNFPLKGKHRQAGCRECHKGNYNQPVAHQLCKDCHADFHKDQFIQIEENKDCSGCHTEDGFSPSTYTVERHNQTGFPLEGAHLATPCLLCHQTDVGKWDFSKKGNNCTDCHQNIHGDELSELYTENNGCEKCHTSLAWDEIRFNHNISSFGLYGRHAQISCRECHFRVQENGDVIQMYKDLPRDCESCHTDVHFKQFVQDNENNCERCHTFRSWDPERFNHDNSRFRLDGEHVGLECVECHKSTENLAQNYIIYKFDSITCATCH